MTSKLILVEWREQNKRGECIHGVSIVRPCDLCYEETTMIAMRSRRGVEPGTQLNLNLLMKERKKGGSKKRLTQKQVNKGGDRIPPG